MQVISHLMPEKNLANVMAAQEALGGGGPQGLIQKIIGGRENVGGPTVPGAPPAVGLLSRMTNGHNFADPMRNGGAPTFGDHLQGIGNSMMANYRGEAPKGTGGQASAGGASGIVPQLAPSLPMTEIAKILMGNGQAPAPTPVQITSGESNEVDFAGRPIPQNLPGTPMGGAGPINWGRQMSPFSRFKM